MNLRIKRKWKWVAKDGDGTFWIYEHVPQYSKENDKWITPGGACAEVSPDLFNLSDEVFMMRAENALWKLG